MNDVLNCHSSFGCNKCAFHIEYSI